MWWWESAAWGSTGAMVWGTCAHVGGGQDYFLRRAMAQVCGVAPGARKRVATGLLNYLVLSQQQWGRLVGTMFFLRLTTARVGISFAPAAVK